jgi:hypothetical protein
VAACGVVRGVLLSGGDLLRMQQLAVRSERASSTAVGSKSMNTARGTCLPALVSEKKVLNASPLTPIGLSDCICPSDRMPEAVQLSAAVPKLDTSLPAIHRHRLPHC